MQGVQNSWLSTAELPVKKKKREEEKTGTEHQLVLIDKEGQNVLKIKITNLSLFRYSLAAVANTS